ncbi:BatA domain-containing protein [Kiritimatiella glycovorans]|uniref:Aerotolerance regulator N-terminal domain-containing protein n=1 Tax=Kiritimatiella glycovorans TaxID=1307763 RepID=A0A0G3EAU3_9BACT|nr:BatA domain-containing protein [Kiritimatiella glycovorans]AKJ63383.1 hypothetical protein L21SP4_00097 [Kiritimatiella glycovorans]
MSGIFFANPLFLQLLPLAALPVIFHFLLRLRKKPHPFPTLMFFRRIDPRLSSRKKIREWLILLLRTLLILLLLLALARPRWQRAGGGGRLATVLVLDNSASMTREDAEGMPLIERAAEAARALLREQRPGDTAALVLLVADPAAKRPDGLTADTGSLLDALDDLEAVECAGRPAQALTTARRILDESEAPAAAVHVFTDLQRNEWGRPASPPGLREGTTVRVHQLRPVRDRDANVHFRELRLPPMRIPAGRTFYAEAVLANNGGAAADILLNTAGGGTEAASRELTLMPGAEARTPIALRAEAPGLHARRMWIEGDAFSADNHAGLAFRTLPRQQVRFAGTRTAYGALPHALSPAGGELTGIETHFESGGDEGADGAERTALHVATYAEFIRRSASLSETVERGGRLLLLPAVTGPGVAERPGRLDLALDAPVSWEEGMRLHAAEPAAAIFDGLRGADGEVSLGEARVMRVMPVRGGEGWTTLLRIETGSPVLAYRRFGRGMIYASGAAFDPGWTTLPLKGPFVVLAQHLALESGDGEEPAFQWVAGEPPPAPAAAEDEALSVTAVEGPPLQWRGPPAERPVLCRAGVYKLAAGSETWYAGVQGDGAEGAQDYMDDSVVPAMEGWRYRVAPLAAPRELVDAVGRFREAFDPFPWIILAALAVLFAEGALANRPPLRAAGRAEP